MIRNRQNAVYAALLLALASAPLGAASFVYEGQLDDRGVPANGRYDVQLAVYQDAELGATLAEPMVFDAVEVSRRLEEHRQGNTAGGGPLMAVVYVHLWRQAFGAAAGSVHRG